MLAELEYGSLFYNWSGSSQNFFSPSSMEPNFFEESVPLLINHVPLDYSAPEEAGNISLCDRPYDNINLHLATALSLYDALTAQILPE